VVIDPMASIINLLPSVDDFTPAFVPTPWRRSAEKWAKTDSKAWDELFREALEENDAQRITWASMFAQEGEDRGQLMNQFALAAVETTAAGLHSFILACIAFPEWIETAQRELDRVVGEDRLPDFKDRPSLPFIEAIVREVLRWNPAVRAGVPHATIADDVVQYQGKEYFIPKGSTIYVPPNVMEHDPVRYESPQVFRPERFLDHEGQLKADYQTTSFGFGRRICVGIPFAERTLWIAIATILWAFDLQKAFDSRTSLPFNYDLSDEAFDGRLTSGPLPFPVWFVPRDEKRRSVTQSEWEDCASSI